MTELARVVHTAVDHTISESTARRIADSVPANTRIAYQRALDKFDTWCEQVGRTAVPCTTETLKEYAGHLADTDVAPRTLAQALGAIVTAHRSAGITPPEWKAAAPIIKGHRVARADRGVRERRPAALTIANLRRISEACDPATPAGVRDRALLLLGFNMMARRSEIVGLDIGDITDIDYGLTVFVKKSKTDQNATGRTVVVGYGSTPETCAVRTVRAWRDFLAGRGITTGPLWRAIDTHGRLVGEPKWLAPAKWKGDLRMSGEAVRLILRRRILAAGVDATGLSPHSLRHGGATESSRAGADREAIARKGGWVPGSAALHGYIEPVTAEKEDPMRGVM